MSDSQGISMEVFKTLSQRAGLKLNDAELDQLKPMYEHYLGSVEAMHELDLDAEDLAVVFSPNWEA